MNSLSTIELETSAESGINKFVEMFKNTPMTGYRYSHSIVDGVYLRHLSLQRGTLIVGATHKRDTTFILLKGSLKISDGIKMKHITAPHMIIAPEGTQRAGYAVEACEIISVHSAIGNTLEEIIDGIAEAPMEILGNEGNITLYIKGERLNEDIKSDSRLDLVYGSLQRIRGD